MAENLGEFIETAAEKYRDKTAFEIKRGIRVDRFSFAQMHDLGDRVATFLERSGVKKGDKIVVLAPNMPEYVLLFFGSWIAGVIVVPIDVRTTRETIGKFVKLTEPKLGFASKYLPNPFAGFGFKTFFLEDLVRAVGREYPRWPSWATSKVGQGEVAEIVFTSGTTGTPKGVILTHKNLLFDIKKVLEVFPLDPSWQILSVLPLSHAFAQVVDLLACFSSGMKVVYLTRMNTLTLRKALRKHKITCMAIVPQVLSLMLTNIRREAEQKGKVAQFELAQKIALALPMSLRRVLFREVHKGFGGKFKFFVCGSAPLDLKLAQAWENMGIEIFEGYGATEMTAGLTLNTPQVKKLGSIGRVLPGMEVRIDENGEIWAKGENISPGYYKNLKRTKEAFVEVPPSPEGYGGGRWYKSGDVGSYDKEGFLYILGRTAFKIVLPSGLKVYPEDVERKLKKHPWVSEACVVGVKKEEGEAVHAVIITPKPGVLDQIVRETNRNLEAHQQILEASVWPEEDFPRTPILKIDRIKVLEGVGRKEVVGHRSEVKGKKVQDKLIQLLSEVSGAREIGETNTLGRDLKLDSLGRVELVSRIEEELGVLVEEQKILPQTTVKALRRLIIKGEGAEKGELPVWPFGKSAVLVGDILQNFFVFPLHGLFVKIRVKNKGNLRRIKPPAIFVFNHLGPYDAVCVPRVLPAKLRKKLVLLADTRDWRRGRGSVGFLVQLFGGLGVSHKGRVKRAALEQVGDLVADGFSLVIAPEGGFSKTGKLGKFKPGVGMLAVELRLPVVPLKISRDYQEIFHPTPFGRWQNYLPKKRGQVTITIGKPLFFPKETSYIEATKKMREEMKRL